MTSVTPSFTEALDYLRGSLPPDPGYDSTPQRNLRTVVEGIDEGKPATFPTEEQ